jgi:hypothetical protein
MGGNAFRAPADGGTTYIDDGKLPLGLFEGLAQQRSLADPQRAGRLRHAGDRAGEGRVAGQALLQNLNSLPTAAPLPSDLYERMQRWR